MKSTWMWRFDLNKENMVGFSHLMVLKSSGQDEPTVKVRAPYFRIEGQHVVRIYTMNLHSLETKHWVSPPSPQNNIKFILICYYPDLLILNALISEHNIITWDLLSWFNYRRKLIAFVKIGKTCSSNLKQKQNWQTLIQNHTVQVHSFNTHFII